MVSFFSVSYCACVRFSKTSVVSSACGENANCSPRNNRAQCTCPEDFLGDPYSRCYTECTRHQDCSSTQVRLLFDMEKQKLLCHGVSLCLSSCQACVKFKCVDPCYVPKQTCGDRADCNVRNHKPICSCPRGTNSVAQCSTYRGRLTQGRESCGHLDLTKVIL